jgi:hypothetical protein
MQVTTAWLQPPTAIGGLDHLGTQAPCVLIYSQLLPGITNVTDRARYFSLYPWFVWSFETRFPEADAENFIEFFRRADCLFTLISERHGRMSDHDTEKHGIAMVGRIKLIPALERLENGQDLRLSEYTDRDSARRYFLNRMGGLGQYYAGTLGQLELMDPSSKPWIKYTIERGKPLAQAVEAAVPSDRFWSVLQADRVTLSDLDALSAFCACRIPGNGNECQALRDIFFDRPNGFAALGEQRRKSLALVMHLARALHAAGGSDLTEEHFRAAIYTGKLPGQTSWAVPEKLRSTLDAWAVYERNDLFSVTMQSVFALCLDALNPIGEGEEPDRSSVEAFAAHLANSADAHSASGLLGGGSFGDLCQALGKDGNLPSSWESPEHEIQIAERLVDGVQRGGKVANLLADAVRILALLHLRDDQNTNPYGSLPISADDLIDYPINLGSFRLRCDKWCDLRLQDVMADLFAWLLNTHLRVALRKLRNTGQSTFRFRPTERGIRIVDDIPPPAPTTPRFRQAVQVLRDIGALTRDGALAGNPTMPSTEGAMLMKEAGG